MAHKCDKGKADSVPNTGGMTVRNSEDTFTKLHVWMLTQYQKVVYLDADTLVMVPVIRVSRARSHGLPRVTSTSAQIFGPNCSRFIQQLYELVHCTDYYSTGTFKVRLQHT